MANKATFTDKGTLQRGKACLRCRDATEIDRPANNVHMLKNQTVLQQRVRELEDPEYISPAVMLHDPHPPMSESSSSSYDSAGSTPISISHSPYPSESKSSPSETWTHLPVSSPSPSPFMSDIFFEGPRSYQSSFDLGPILLDIFSPHRHQCGLALDSEDPWTSIDCPWPQDITDYESGNATVSNGFPTVKTFLQGDVSGGFSMQTWRAKASAIFSRADQLAASWRYRLSGVTYPEEFQVLELTINRFLPTILPIHQLNATILEEKHTLIVVHTLIQVSVLMLYQRFAQDDPVTYDKCSAAAKACVAITKFISEQDYDYLDPIIGSCWTTVAEWLICEITNIESAWALSMTSTDVRNDISTIL
ncbi:hypothetical protein HHX47_DHR3000157 [Lentinula edodes]|nr:hypothetical protein HHX47_DHR3000157 [Lentinula edodes]